LADAGVVQPGVALDKWLVADCAVVHFPPLSPVLPGQPPLSEFDGQFFLGNGATPRSRTWLRLDVGRYTRIYLAINTVTNGLQAPLLLRPGAEILGLASLGSGLPGSQKCDFGLSRTSLTRHRHRGRVSLRFTENEECRRLGYRGRTTPTQPICFFPVASKTARPVVRSRRTSRPSARQSAKNGMLTIVRTSSLAAISVQDLSF